MFYWLRRIPAETRIVVLVVFLALFQAILLSLFGLRAIRNEREDVAATLADRAERFLLEDVAVRCESAIHKRADEAGRAAFDNNDPAWRRRGANLFTEAFLMLGDGRIRDTLGRPAWWPRELVADAQQAHRSASAARQAAWRGHEFDETVKARHSLEFALGFPFLLDETGESLSLLHASTPLMVAGENAPGPGTLLAIRWVGVVNRVAGYLPADSVERFLARVDEAAGDNPEYARGRERQERWAHALTALVKERGTFRASAPRGLHRNIHVAARDRFYLRPVGGEGDVHVLAVDPARLEAFLSAFATAAHGRAPEGVTPSIGPEADATDADQAIRMDALPGYVAWAHISRATVLQQTAARERFYWYIIGFSVVGILAGGILTARAVMREMKLAKLKAGFVSNVSHGLKTPLTSIRMFSDMLRSGQVKDEAERNECLEVIAQETERLGRLIQQVLDFGRLEARKRTFHWTTGPLEPIVTKEAERFRRTTGLAEEEFSVRIAVNLPPVTHDPEAVGEVITNLLSNAYKYTTSPGRRIDLTLGPQRGRVVLIVEDNGPGIPSRERRKIFDQFYRSDDLLTREVEGTGLGLSIVRNIVQAHGGRILVEDGGRGGSRFVVVLPASPRRGASPEPAPAETTR